MGGGRSITPLSPIRVDSGQVKRRVVVIVFVGTILLLPVMSVVIVVVPRDNYIRDEDVVVDGILFSPPLLLYQFHDLDNLFFRIRGRMAEGVYAEPLLAYAVVIFVWFLSFLSVNFISRPKNISPKWIDTENRN